MRIRLLVEGTADDTWIGLLGVADLAGFVDFLAGDAEIGGSGRRRKVVLAWNDFRTTRLLTDFATLLRRVIFVRQPAFRARLDLNTALDARRGNACRGATTTSCYLNSV